MYSVLIMGGSDFIGSSLAKYFIKKGYKVDIITRGIKPINYYGIQKHLICDRTKDGDINNIIQENKYDYVYDISARNKDDIEKLINNLDITQLKKYIFISPNKCNTDILTEQLKIEKFIERTSIPYIIVKYSNIYGLKNESSKEICLFKKIEKSDPIKIPKNRKMKTQFIYIDDFIKVLYSLVKTTHVREIYNVTNPQVISLEEYIRTCSEIIEKEPDIKYIDSSKMAEGLKEEFEGSYLDIDKTIEHGLYIPNILLINGLSMVYDWYKNNNHKKVSIKDKLVRVLQI